MVRYSLFVLKVPLNTNQLTEMTHWHYGISAAIVLLMYPHSFVFPCTVESSLLQFLALA